MNIPANILNNGILISVIVTTFNRNEMLQETINSILNQTYSSFELIVVDNFSDYDFPSVMESYDDKRIKFFQNKNNGIIAVNRNFGINKAKGEFIAFCDDDDLWNPDKLLKQLNCFNRNNIVAAGTLSVLFGEDKLFKRKRDTNFSANVKLIGFDEIKKNNNVPLSSLMVKRNIFRFSEEKKFSCVEDWDYQLQLTQQGDLIGLLLEPLIKYRIPTLTPYYPEKSLNKVHVFHKYRKRFADAEYKAEIAKYYSFIALKYLKIGDKKNAVLYFQKNTKSIPMMIMIFFLKVTPSAFIKFALHLFYKWR